MGILNRHSSKRNTTYSFSPCRAAIPGVFLFLCSGSVFMYTGNLYSQTPTDSLPVLELPEHTVTESQTEHSGQTFSQENLKSGIAGIGDPVRSLNQVSQASTQNDLNARPFLRGGSDAETRVHLNGLSLMQPYHVGGVFSLFQMESVQKASLHTGYMPVSLSGSLSGALDVQTRAPSLDEARLHTNLSLVRGNLFLEAPVVKNKFSLSFGAQSFWFNQTTNGLLDLMSSASDNPTFKADIQSYKEHINLPLFQDYQLAALWQVSENLSLEYTGILGRDSYAVVIPETQNVFREIDSQVVQVTVPVANPNPTLLPREEINRSKSLSVDSLSAVEVDNFLHMITLPWSPHPGFYTRGVIAFQQQNWDVAFKDDAELQSPVALAQNAKTLDGGWQADWQFHPKHRLSGGADVRQQIEEYFIDMPYALYDVITRSNLDMLGSLGWFTRQGFTINRVDTGTDTFDYLAELPLRIQSKIEGTSTLTTAGMFLEHRWRFRPWMRFKTGARLAWESHAGTLNPLPRMEVNWFENKAHGFTTWAGFFQQEGSPFYQRASNPRLEPERSRAAGISGKHEWTRQFSTNWDLYYKSYSNLSVPRLTPNGSVDAKGLMIPAPNTGYSSEYADSLRSKIKKAEGTHTLDSGELAAAGELFGSQNLTYVNGGTGYAWGAELDVLYQPFTWMSDQWLVSFGQSLRKDSPGEEEYPYRYHRPWSAKWIHKFFIKNNFQLSFSYQRAAGFPYTPYSGTLNQDGGDGPIWVGARNSGRLKTYSRMDLRLLKTHRIFNQRMETFLEVWNATNQPNYFSRDAETGEIKAASLNWPFPFVFVGISLHI